MCLKSLGKQVGSGDPTLAKKLVRPIRSPSRLSNNFNALCRLGRMDLGDKVVALTAGGAMLVVSAAEVDADEPAQGLNKEPG